jgi:hypothetical protein
VWQMSIDIILGYLVGIFMIRNSNRVSNWIYDIMQVRQLKNRILVNFKMKQCKMANCKVNIQKNWKSYRVELNSKEI